MVPTETKLVIPPGVPGLLRDLVHERTGLFFDDDRLDTMVEKLSPRAAASGRVSLLDYYYTLKYEENNDEEWRRVMDAFSVQETYFFREYAQIETLVNVFVPKWFSRTTRPLRIWSAACASGEEPYSIAIALREGGWGSHPIEIFASDASGAALDRAQAAVYRERSFRSFPAHLRRLYFEQGADGARLRTNLLLPVRFARINLANSAEVAPHTDSPAIFCRNVFIYFSSQAIQRTVGYFANGMPDGGHLFIGASESLLKLNTAYELQEINGAFVYVRHARANARKP